MASHLNEDGEVEFLRSLHAFSKLELNRDQIKNDSLLAVLKSVTEWLKVEENRKTMREESLRDLVSILHQSSQHLDETGTLIMITELFRCLRNACAGCTRNQLLLNKFSSVFEDTIYILSHHLTEGVSQIEVLQCLRCGVQFLGNAAVSMPSNANLIMELFFSKFRNFLTSNDKILSKYTCMLLHSCLYTEGCQSLLSSEEGLSIIYAVLDLLIQHNVDWGLFITEKMLMCRGFMSSVYKALDENKRMLLLDVVYSVFEKHSENKDPQMGTLPVEPQNIFYLAQEFISTAYVILGTSSATSSTNVESTVVMKILDVLCAASFHPVMQPEVQKISELLQSAVNLLHCLHMIGQQGDNAFTSAQKIVDQADIDHSHPAFGLKKDLIRLVGNMCHKHRANQDKVREMGGIGLILDHTSIDDKNPYIMQWSVFAIHNLCEENLENQAVIAGECAGSKQQC